MTGLMEQVAALCALGEAVDGLILSIANFTFPRCLQGREKGRGGDTGGAAAG